MAVEVDVVLDTNILLRMPFDSPAELTLASRAVYHLLARGYTLGTTVANIAEFVNSGSRPVSANGLGLSTQALQKRIQLIERRFPIFVESMRSYDIWKELVIKYGVQGVKVHDARIASVMLECRIRAILTLNASDFERFDEITALHPEKVLEQA